jgi:hypothetical protein
VGNIQSKLDGLTHLLNSAIPLYFRDRRKHRLSQHHCPRCKTPVVIPEGQPGALCPNCRSAVTLERVQPQPKPHRGSPALRIILVAAILAMVGVWLYVGPLAPEPGIDLTGEPRAASVTPRRFVLWELHADDTVRVVELHAKADAAGSMALMCNQVLNSRDDVLSLETIGGRLSDEGVYEEEYGGKTYERPWYMLDATRDQYGYAARIDRPPHLHINGDERLISIGVDPKTYAQETIAVAIPVSARLRRIYDHQPYRHVTLDEWDIFYYDLTDIQGHVSIHIAYTPGEDAPSLDWSTVEASR